MKISNLKIIINSKGFFLSLSLVIIDLALIAGLAYMGFNLYNLSNDLNTARFKFEEAKQTATLVNNNKKLLEAKISTFNTALDGLIPDQESFFQIITAFERLSQKTGLVISNYSINLDDTTSEKITFSLNIEGSPQQLQNFLNTYSYAGGRLLVSDKFSFTQGEQSSLSIDLSFFNGLYTEENNEFSEVPIVNEEDVLSIEEILSKME